MIIKNNMNRIDLPKGFTFLSGRKRGGKSRFALKWANHLAKTQKVLYLNWGSYEEKHIHDLKQMGDEISLGLTIDSEYDFLDSNSFIEIYNHLEKDRFDVVFFDDIQYTVYNHFNDNYFADQSAISNALVFLSQLLDVKVILVSEVSDMWNEYRGDLDLLLRIFPREIVNKSNQIYFLNRPYLNDFKEDHNGNSTIHHIELISLKNKDNKEFKYILDNSTLNIYNDLPL